MGVDIRLQLWTKSWGLGEQSHCVVHRTKYSWENPRSSGKTLSHSREWAAILSKFRDSDFPKAIALVTGCSWVWWKGPLSHGMPKPYYKLG